LSNNEKEILFKSNGWLAMNKIGAFIGMHIIFMQNYKDLMIIISKIQNPQIIFEQRTDLTLNYINKYIFNFISSATALRDNFNELVKKYKNTELGKEIDINIKKTFKNNLECAFIQKYRNIHTHKRLAIAYLSDDDKILWDTAHLINISDEWNSLSKQYIKNCGESISLEELFTKYFETINSFYKWLYPLIINWHKKDIYEMILIARELNHPLPKVYYDIIQG